MKNFLTFMLFCAVATPVLAMGRKAGDGDDIHPVQRGSPANPNSAYNPPAWNYTPPPGQAANAKKHASAAKPAAPKPVPDSPAPKAETYPDYTAPQPANATATAPPLAKDSIEPPLPDEPGGNLDKKPAFK